MSSPDDPAGPDAPPAPAERRCPACGRPRDRRFSPFCSAGCRDRDLLGWLDERYSVPVVERGEQGEDEESGRFD